MYSIGEVSHCQWKHLALSTNSFIIGQFRITSLYRDQVLLLLVFTYLL